MMDDLCCGYGGSLSTSGCQLNTELKNNNVSDSVRIVDFIDVNIFNVQ